MGMRRLTLFAAAHAAGTALLLGALPHLMAETRAGDPGAALLLIAGTATAFAGARTTLSVLLAHLWRLCTTTGLAASPIRAAALRVAPGAARTALTAAVGGSLSVAVLAGPSVAASSSPAWPLSPTPAEGPAHTQQRDPAWPLSEDPSAAPPSAPGAPSSPPAPGPGGDDARVHVVASGESLWRIVASELPGAEAAEIAARVADVHAANRGLLGDDAGLILPGQRLVLP